MDIKIKQVFCGNKNCIGLEGWDYGKKPKRQIIIEDVWDEPVEIIENAMPGLISHETIEHLTYCILSKDEEANIHELIGSGQETKDYAKNTDGLVIIYAVKPH